MMANGFIQSGAMPSEMMEGLAKVASAMIKDTQKRGWKIIEDSPKHIIMRRTQTFNSTLQFGLLDELFRKKSYFS
jgi:hypothetical protein